MADQTLFNVNQLATYDEARAMRTYLGTIGGGVLDGDDEKGVQFVANPSMPWLPPTQQIPGIYVPSWEGGPGGFAVPHDGDKRFLHFRFKNGASGMNVGLIIDKFRRYPNSPAYVLGEIAREAASMAK